MIEKKSTEREIRSCCTQCRSRLCKRLFFKNIFVFSDFFAIPFDCPLRVEYESQLHLELQSLSDYNLSCIAGEIWVKHNLGARSSNNKHQEIEHIISHFRQSKCSMIAKSAAPYYKPWTLFGFQENSSVYQLQSFKRKKKKISVPPVHCQILTGSYQ